jgi:hypothetical protein
LDLDSDWIRIGIQPKMLDPDPYQSNPDPKHWLQRRIFTRGGNSSLIIIVWSTEEQKNNGQGLGHTGIQVVMSDSKQSSQLTIPRHQISIVLIKLPVQLWSPFRQ